MGAPRGSLRERLWRKVRETPTCWLWTGGVYRNGYGRIREKVNGRWRDSLTHRVAWRLTHDAIPSGMDVCHHCDTPNCVNPSHLFLGTRKENMQDALRKGRLRFWNRGKTHCMHGHALTGDNVKVTKVGKRRCLTCDRTWGHTHRPRVGKAE